jgi:hypothetical protein
LTLQPAQELARHVCDRGAQRTSASLESGMM